jgi:hypothetical protein
MPRVTSFVPVETSWLWAAPVELVHYLGLPRDDGDGISKPPATRH